MTSDLAADGGGRVQDTERTLGFWEKFTKVISFFEFEGLLFTPDF